MADHSEDWKSQGAEPEVSLDAELQPFMAGSAWLVGGGEMGALIRSMDWSRTPLGPIEHWPQSLRTAAGLCLASSFPINLVWGPNAIQLYNDGYRVVCGSAHPRTMGQSFRESWASAWPSIGEPFERARAGDTSFLENVRMFLERNGYPEETFFTFSFSPIRDESGGVGGLFHPVTETTAAMLAQRRTRALRDLAARAGEARSAETAFTVAAAVLSEYEFDLPLVLMYDVDDYGMASLVGSTGLPPGTSASPMRFDTEAPDAPWAFGDVLRSGQGVTFTDVVAVLAGSSCGPYPEAPSTALLLPISRPGTARPAGVLVAGVSPRLPLTDVYRGFCEQVTATVSAAVASARGYEEASRRAEVLAELDRAKTTFFSNVSHEFRTPLTLMLGPLEDLLRRDGETAGGELPDKVRGELDLVHRNALRLLRLVNTLLDFSRIEAGRVEAVYEPTDLAAYTTDLASAFRAAAERGGLQLIVDAPELPEPAYVDREMWEKIVLNLLSNALKHTFAGEVRVSLRIDDTRILLEVRDTGTGIPAEQLPRLFERFHRVQGARSRTHEGTGIGLALVRELAALHGGDVQVTSTVDQGSAFSVRIPRGAAHLPADRVGAPRSLESTAMGATPYVAEMLRWMPDAPRREGLPAATQADDGETSAETTTSGARILLADDNADMREYVARLLRERGWIVDTAANGREALDAARAQVPDLVLSDVMMPVLDGFALLRELRADPRTRMAPVILLSARAGEESRVEGLEAGADDYLVKPFAARELVARVGANLELARMRQDVLRAQAASQAKTDFLTTMSHELRTPLNAIGGYAALMELGIHGPVTTEQRTALDRIQRSQRHLLGLVTQVLNFSRIEAGHVQYDVQDVSVHEALAEVRGLLDPQAIGRGIEVEQSGDAGSIAVRADPAKLQQILLNLLSNAVKFAAPGAHIVLGCEQGARDRVGGMVAISVRDSGPGIPSDRLEQIFEPFVQLDQSLTRRTEGTGLGLAISRDLARGMGGDLTVESTRGVGSLFTLTLPRA